MLPKAIIFDLDGVLTDTAEFHYQAWQQLADEEGLSFDRTVNEKLRGVSRRASLQIILGDRIVDEAAAQAMMARKNGYYVDLLGQISPEHLLPGVIELLDLLDDVGIPYALGSASRNAPVVVGRLGPLQSRLGLAGAAGAMALPQGGQRRVPLALGGAAAG